MLRAVHTDRTHTLDVCTRAELRTALHKQATGHGIDYRKFPVDMAHRIRTKTCFREKRPGLIHCTARKARTAGGHVENADPRHVIVNDTMDFPLHRLLRSRQHDRCRPTTSSTTSTHSSEL